VIAGEAVAPPFLKDIMLVVNDHGEALVAKVETLHLGPETVLVALTLKKRGAPPPDLDALMRRIKAVDAKIAHLMMRVEA
jgi:hypothetical protein